MNIDRYINILDSPNAIQAFGNNVGLLKSRLIFISEFDSDDSINEQISSEILKELGIIRDVLLNKPIHPEISNLILGFCKIVTDWNRKNLRNKEVGNAADFIDRFSRMHLSSIEVLASLRSVLLELRKAQSAGLYPIHLTQQFFKSIAEEIQDEES